MTTENTDDNDDLYHVDFTTASEWEVFIARIEEILQQWKLHNSKYYYSKEKLINATWVATSENLNFADFEFVLTRHFVKNHDDNSLNTEEEKNEMPPALLDMMNNENDFIPTKYEGDEYIPHSLVRWYGLRNFVVLSPLKGCLSSESKLRVLLSSFAIALNNIACQVPMFVQFHDPRQRFYVGICEGTDIRAEFDMVHLKRIPSQCRHLTGLLNVFKSKIGQNEFVEPVTVAARFAYTLNDWPNFAWTQDPPDIELLGETGWSELGSLPFGAICEPISALTLFATWPEVLETMTVDNESYSDFDPVTAPTWSISINRVENPVCLLFDYLSEFLFFCTSSKTTEDLLGDFALKDSNDMLQPFSLLTESRIPTLSNLLSQYASKKKSIEGPINQKLLMPILYYIFPDVEEDSKHPYKDEKDLDTGTVQRMKTCAQDSLIWRLALVMAHALHMFGGARAAAHIWHEFSQEIRFRWNSGNMIPGYGLVKEHDGYCIDGSKDGQRNELCGSCGGRMKKKRKRSSGFVEVMICKKRRRRPRCPRKKSRRPRRKSRCPRKKSRCLRKRSCGPRRKSRCARKKSRGPRRKSRCGRKKPRCPSRMRRRPSCPRKKARCARKKSRCPRKKARCARKKPRCPRRHSVGLPSFGTLRSIGRSAETGKGQGQGGKDPKESRRPSGVQHQRQEQQSLGQEQ